MSHEFCERDFQWAEAVRNGDATAFEALFRAYAGPLCRFVTRHVREADIAEEIVQDVFLEIWRRRLEWQPTVNVRAYLYRSARNRALDYLDHQRIVDKWQQQAVREAALTSPVIEEPMLQQELAKAIDAAIEQLPERRRLIFTLVRCHDMTYAEVAETLNISVNTVETQMTRAFKTLRTLLAHCLPAIALIAGLLFIQ